MELLNAQQFAHNYPFECSQVQSEEYWSRMLLKWREEGKLIERDHWLYRRGDGGRISRYYNNVKVIKLIIKEARGERPRPSVSYLFQQYLEEFVIILEDNKDVRVVTTDKFVDVSRKA